MSPCLVSSKKIPLLLVTEDPWNIYSEISQLSPGFLLSRRELSCSINVSPLRTGLFGTWIFSLSSQVLSSEYFQTGGTDAPMSELQQVTHDPEHKLRMSLGFSLCGTGFAPAVRKCLSPGGAGVMGSSQHLFYN